MAKAEKAKTEKTEARKAPIWVQGDPRWWSLPTVYERLLPQLRKSTASGLMTALKSGKLFCVRLSEKNPNQCKPVPRKFWRDRQFDATWIGAGDLDICSSNAVPGPRRPRDPQTDADGSEFYVWQPWEVWPVPQATKENEPEALGRKRGRKPKHPWKMFIAAKAWEEIHKPGLRPSADYFAQLCENKFKWQPDISEINELLKVLDY
jgi:hypothetical protein